MDFPPMSSLDKNRLCGLLDDNFLMPRPYSGYPLMRQGLINQMNGRIAQYDDCVDYMRRPGLYQGPTFDGVPLPGRGSEWLPHSLPPAYGTSSASRWDSGVAGYPQGKVFPTMPPLPTMPPVADPPIKEALRRAPSPSSSDASGFTPSHSDGSYQVPHRGPRDQSTDSTTVSDRGDESQPCSCSAKDKETKHAKAACKTSERRDSARHAETRSRKEVKPTRGRSPCPFFSSDRLRRSRYASNLDDARKLDGAWLGGPATRSPFLPNANKTTWRPWVNSNIPDVKDGSGLDDPFRPPYEVISSPCKVSVYVALAGAGKLDVNVLYDAVKHTLRLDGRVPRPAACLELLWRRVGGDRRDHGLFEADIVLPGSASDVRNITATMEDGLLSIEVESNDGITLRHVEIK